MPDAFYRLLAFPNGIAMIGLGYSLWSRTADARPSHQSTPSRTAASDSCRLDAWHQPGAGRTGPARGAARSGWPVRRLARAGLIPVAGGSGRLVELPGGPEVLPTDPRFAASPVPLVVHIVAAVVYALLGAFQFSARLRRRHPGWHRRAGRVLVVLGLAVALSALWMTLFYPREARRRAVDGPAAGRLGDGRQPRPRVAAIRRRDIARTGPG